ncbi:MAG: porin [Comamonas sp.]|nr:porin [Comamonas sp.]
MTKTSRVMLAVLALCGTSAALAQSSVTLYGRVNTTVENWKIGNTNSITGLRTNSSYVGFRGTEDLGGGLKAGFQLEGAFGSDDGSGPFNFSRHSEINLSGGFGTLRLGTFNAASYLATADYISMHNHDTGLSADALYAYTMREENKIAYVTPDFGGFTAEVQHSFHEQTSGGRNAWDLALNYGKGPLGFGLGYSNSPTGLAGFTTPKGQQVAARLSYAVGALTLGAYYQYAKLENATDLSLATAGGDVKRHAARLSAMYVLGASEFHANVGRADKIKVNGSSVSGSAATQWTLGYNYNLSKRTKAYGYFTKIGDGSAERYGDLRSVAIGVRHLF